jgi:hypothetical protein
MNGVTATGGGGSQVNGLGNSQGGTGLAIPKTVIDEGVKITRDCLELVCEVEP